MAVRLAHLASVGAIRGCHPWVPSVGASLDPVVEGPAVSRPAPHAESRREGHDQRAVGRRRGMHVPPVVGGASRSPVQPEGVAPDRGVAIAEPRPRSRTHRVPVDLEDGVRSKEPTVHGPVQPTSLPSAKRCRGICAASSHLCEPPVSGEITGRFVELVPASEPLHVLLLDTPEGPEVGVSADAGHGQFFGAAFQRCDQGRRQRWWRRHAGGRWIAGPQPCGLVL